mmetsp:Transcript_14112/g.32844  ORF Transcript_14112/g.32844 Transcript_14112/m.32844 type:complete len:103 (+) Transcript_14112:2488-2796(+)
MNQVLESSTSPPSTESIKRIKTPFCIAIGFCFHLRGLSFNFYYLYRLVESESKKAHNNAQRIHASELAVTHQIHFQNERIHGVSSSSSQFTSFHPFSFACIR